jgi:Zn-finger nucleic acid-binding protein
MRRLAACPSCRRQYDASHLTPGEKFRCFCGSPIVISTARPREAAVVRCSGCGAPREGEARSCRYCQADFTLHDQDLETVCPSCLARISNRARFCHDCGTRIAPEAAAGATTDVSCPACGSARKLRHRELGGERTPSLECNACAGSWLARDAFESLLERARSAAAPLPSSGGPAPESRGRLERVVYRRCPVCAERMNRQNFGRRSGFVLDLCPDHGVWFDASELDGVLAWVRRGGERRTAELEREEERSAAMRERFRIEPRTPETTPHREHERDAGDWLETALEILCRR